MLTLVKFIRRRMPAGTRGFDVMSKTLGKSVLIDLHYKPEGESGVLPKHDELWIVEILRETSVGSNKGCFIVNPVRLVEIPGDSGKLHVVQTLVPGLYSTSSPEPKTLIVKPSLGEDAHPWMLPLEIRKQLKAEGGYVAIVVNLGGEYWHYPQDSLHGTGK